MTQLLKGNVSTIGFSLSLLIIAYLLLFPKTEYVPIEYKEDESLRDTVTVTKTIIDTVTVYDTTRVKLEIPEPIKKDSINLYTTYHTDSFLSASITSKVYGRLLSQNLFYIKKIDYIDRQHTTHQIVYKYFKPTRVYAPKNNRKGIWIGIDASIEPTVTPNIMYTTGNTAYTVGYNLNKETLESFNLSALRVGIKTKL